MTTPNPPSAERRILTALAAMARHECTSDPDGGDRLREMVGPAKDEMDALRRALDAATTLATEQRERAERAERERDEMAVLLNNATRLASDEGDARASWQTRATAAETARDEAIERARHAEGDSDRWERAHDVLLADWREVDALPAVRAAFCEGMKLSDAVAAALADVHYAEGTPLFDAEVAKREAESERDEAIERFAALLASHEASEAAWLCQEEASGKVYDEAIKRAERAEAKSSAYAFATDAARDELRDALAASQAQAAVLREAIEGRDPCDEGCMVMKPYRGCRCGDEDLRTALASTPVLALTTVRQAARAEAIEECATVAGSYGRSLTAGEIVPLLRGLAEAEAGK